MSVDLAFLACIALNLSLGTLLGLFISHLFLVRRDPARATNYMDPADTFEQLRQTLEQHETSMRDLGGYLETVRPGDAASNWKREISARRQSNLSMVQLLGLWKQLLNRMSPGETTIRGEVERYQSDCESLETALAAVAHQDPPDDLGNLVGAISTILERNRQLNGAVADLQRQLSDSESQLRQARSESRVDSLTHLGNRRAFDERLVELHNLFERTGAIYSLTMLDVDHFKRLNDQFGHAVGDNVLATIGKVMKSTCRLADSVFRYGGEEFAVLSASTALDGASIMAERLRAKVDATEFLHARVAVPFTISLGVAAARPGETTAELIARADAALYAAKNTGRNCVVRSGEEPTADPSAGVQAAASTEQPEPSLEKGVVHATAPGARAHALHLRGEHRLEPASSQHLVRT